MSSDMSTRRIMVRSEKVLSGLIAKVDAAARHFKCIVIQSWYQRFSVVATAVPPPGNLCEQRPGRRAVGPGRFSDGRVADRWITATFAAEESAARFN